MQNAVEDKLKGGKPQKKAHSQEETDLAKHLLYLLISKPDMDIDYLFLDEAHKLSGKNSRGPFYEGALKEFTHKIRDLWYDWRKEKFEFVKEECNYAGKMQMPVVWM